MADKQLEKDVSSIPDPEEDDLDDLDDVLDEFQSQPKPTASTAPTPSGPGRPPSQSKDGPATGSKEEEDLAAQLQSGMQNLMSELDSNPQMQAEFEKMMQELVAASSGGSNQEAGEHLKAAAAAVPQPTESSKPKASGGASSSKKGGGGGEDFNETIRRTMERMQASDTKASTSQSQPSNSEDELLAQMMKELSGEGGDGDFNSMLMNMMAHLTNKEILYDPMKELHDKFPDWMSKNKDSCSKEDLKRYEEQQKLVGEIVARFERKGYSDENEEDREYIVERMQKMQSQGSPPSDLVGDMSAAQEALGDLDGGCPTQ
ncbi:Peroxisomal biogenesis factor 19 [Lecanosticta acicola]|uniref:Peroxisomal biogenesis factor 19 n=1 Tax=Lecanosticta acicola TaxID=111012 RepID=A0AAI8YYM0_9PEZI|nr:Peroxisomal biogenesis factor 19 [Lecanosticta acicola]